MSLAGVLAAVAEQQSVAVPVAGNVTTIGSDSSSRSRSGSIDIDFTGMTLQAGDVAVLTISADAHFTIHQYSFSSTGWILRMNEMFNHGRNSQVTQFYKKLDGTETIEQITSTQPTESAGIEQWGFTCEVSRGVELTNVFDTTFVVNDNFIFGSNNSTPTNQPITTSTPNAKVCFLHGWNGTTQISSVGLPNTPAGMIQGLTQSTDSHIRFAQATLENAGAVGTVTPSAWTHSHSSEQRFWCLTYALRAAT